MSAGHAGKIVGESMVLGNERQAIEVRTLSAQGLWELANNLTHLRSTKKPQFRVTIFGLARIPRDHWVYATFEILPRNWHVWAVASLRAAERD